MKKLTLLLVVIMVLTAVTFAFAGCGKLSIDDGMAELKEAYTYVRDELANESDAERDIYMYNEKIYDKATQDKEGYIINRMVNINCEVDKHYNIIKENKYSIRTTENKRMETIDATSKIKTKNVVYNELCVGPTKDTDGNSVDAIFTVSEDYLMKEQDSESTWQKKYSQLGVTTDDIYHSDFFKKNRLMELRAIKELGTLIDNPDMLDFDIEKGGIEKKGFTTDYKFKVKDEYLDRYEQENGKPSVYDGTHIWIQISYGRLSNIYVYKEEMIGDMKLDYESYILTITYVGPKIDMAVYGAKQQESGDYIFTPNKIYHNGNMLDSVFVPV